MDGWISLQWNNHQNSFIHTLLSISQKNEFSDVTLVCDGTFYPSHKIVLSTCSDYFREIFQITGNGHPVIVLKDIKPQDAEDLLIYMYKGEVKVPPERLSSFIKAAECLKIKGLTLSSESLTARKEPDQRKTYSREAIQERKRKRMEEQALFDSLPETSTHLTERISLDSSNLTEIQQSHSEIKTEPPDDGDVIDETNTSSNLSHSKMPDLANNFLDLGSADQSSQELTLDLPLDTQQGVDRLDDPQPPSPPVNENIAPPQVISNEDLDQVSQDVTTETRPPDTPIGNPRNWDRYKCPLCVYKTNTKFHLEKHLRIHSGVKPYGCFLCPYRSTQKSNLKVHFKRKHSL